MHMIVSVLHYFLDNVKMSVLQASLFLLYEIDFQQHFLSWLYFETQIFFSLLNSCFPNINYNLF